MRRDKQTADLRVAAILVDLISLTWAQIGPWYHGEQRQRVYDSFAAIAHAAIEALRER